MAFIIQPIKDTFKQKCGWLSYINFWQWEPPNRVEFMTKEIQIPPLHSNEHLIAHGQCNLDY